jgi:conjugative transfer signal peptidase TraF
MHPAPKLLWNASASVPIGLYRVRPVGALRVNDLVVVNPPDPLAGYMADRGYLPRRVPLLKHILALPGQTICRSGATVTVGGHIVGAALDRDRMGRPLPVWHGCRVVGANDVFVMNPDVQDSFDGRYFGSISISAIVGRAEPLWTKARR